MVKATFQLLIGAMAIGIAPVFVKLLTTSSDVGAIGAGFWRMSIGALGFFLMIQFSDKTKKHPRIEKFWQSIPWWPLVISGMMFALDLTAWHTSFNFTSIAASTLIANLSSLFVPICGVIFYKEPLRAKIVYGGIVAIIGVIGLTVFKSNLQIQSNQSSLLWGEGLAFLTAFFYTAYILVIKKLSIKYETRNLMFMSSTISAIGLFLISLGMNDQILPTTSIGWIWIACLGLVSQVMGQGLVSKALSVLPVGQSALILLSAPTASSVFGWLIFNEGLTIGQIISVFVTLIGIAIVSK